MISESPRERRSRSRVGHAPFNEERETGRTRIIQSRSGRDYGIDAAVTGPWSERARFIAFLGVFALCLLGGGASRSDVLSLIYLRPAFILCIVFTLLTPGPVLWHPFRAATILLGAFAGLMLLQLVPLPPGLWQSLPGHERYAEAAIAANIPQPWRPISLTPTLTWNSLLALLAPATVLASAAAFRRDQVHALLHVLIVIAGASALLGLLQLGSSARSSLFLYRVTHNGSAVGFFANRNHQATLLALTFPMLRLLTLLPARRPNQHRTRLWVAAGIGTFLIPMILITGSRAGAFLALVGLTGAIALAPISANFSARHASPFRRRLWTAVLVAMPLLLSATVIFFGRALAIQRLIAPNALGDEERFERMPTVLGMVREFMPFGTGFGSFDDVYRGFEPFQALDPKYFNHAHNDFVETALTGGAAGVALVLLFAGWWMQRSAQVFRNYTDTSEDTLYARTGSLTIFILVLASLVDYPLRTPLMAMIFAVAAVWLSLGGRVPHPGSGVRADTP